MEEQQLPKQPEVEEIPLRTLHQVVLDVLPALNKRWSDVLWIGSQDGKLTATPEQFQHHFGAYLVRTSFDVPQNLVLVGKDWFMLFRPEDEKAAKNPSLITCWKVFNVRLEKNSRPVTPYNFFDCNNFRGTPELSVSNDLARQPIYLLGLDHIKLRNELAKFYYNFDIINEAILNPRQKNGPLHQRVYGNLKLNDIQLRIYVQGFDDYSTSPDRLAILEYIEQNLKTNRHFIKLEDVEQLSSMLVFFRPLGELEVEEGD